ncbi:probable RNA-binding protein 46 [Xyrichtys novacula]|uniref:Probable RNA-binding protein 46 n=1 Tax=Xyrichtys novacula TaxID=13765 RepID=A0AAV1FEG5_XYRNO|nr:probable RNA-binding protein 46 [Xyrichtys novacula]
MASPTRVASRHVGTLMLSTTGKTLHQDFSCFIPGSVERVERVRNHAFNHYRCRDDALANRMLMNGAMIDGAHVQVSLAKPASMKGGGVPWRLVT